MPSMYTRQCYRGMSCCVDSNAAHLESKPGASENGLSPTTQKGEGELLPEERYSIPAPLLKLARTILDAAATGKLALCSIRTPVVRH